MNKRKIMIIISSFLVMMVIITGSTLAYFTDQENKNNKFNMANVDITLTEDFDTKAASNMLPGTNTINYVEKQPFITNSGTADVYVRLKISIPTVLDTPIRNIEKPLHWNYDNEHANKWGWLKANGQWNYKTITGQDNVQYNVYYAYYLPVLKVKETTDGGFIGCYIDKEITQKDIATLINSKGLSGSYTIEKDGDYILDTQSVKFNIDVTAEAIQAKGFTSCYSAFMAFDGVQINGHLVSFEEANAFPDYR